MRFTRLHVVATAATLGVASLVLSAPAFAGAIVDPNTLQPVPPNATCRDDGRQIICDTFVDEFAVNEAISDFDLPCGTIYETSHYHGAGTRWYVDPRRHLEPLADGRRTDGKDQRILECLDRVDNSG
jgi:hypothetical protein